MVAMCELCFLAREGRSWQVSGKGGRGGPLDQDFTASHHAAGALGGVWFSAECEAQ